MRPIKASDLGLLLPKTPQQRPSMYALGRLKTGEMNQTEARYAAKLSAQTAAGELAWWKFEALKLRLADATFFTPDFFVMLPNGELVVKELKGHMMDDANVKIKVAASMFPFRFFVVRAIPKKEGGGFSEVQV